ncbi:hypothetical protein [Mycobacterium sp. URHB0021]|jgi:hypothetical protein
MMSGGKDLGALAGRLLIGVMVDDLEALGHVTQASIRPTVEPGWCCRPTADAAFS